MYLLCKHEHQTLSSRSPHMKAAVVVCSWFQHYELETRAGWPSNQAQPAGFMPWWEKLSQTNKPTKEDRWLLRNGVWDWPLASTHMCRHTSLDMYLHTHVLVHTFIFTWTHTHVHTYTHRDIVARAPRSWGLVEHLTLAYQRYSPDSSRTNTTVVLRAKTGYPPHSCYLCLFFFISSKKFIKDFESDESLSIYWVLS